MHRMLLKREILIHLFALHFNQNLIYKGNHLLGRKKYYYSEVAPWITCSNEFSVMFPLKANLTAVHTESIFHSTALLFHCFSLPGLMAFTYLGGTF